MKYFKILIAVILLNFAEFTYADDFVPEGESEIKVSADNFILDADNTGGDVQLQFGEILGGEFLQWNETNTRFNLSNTLRVTGNLEQDGSVMTIDADNVGVGTNIDIVANQGTDNNGTLRYNSTTNKWELSNDGTGFSPIVTGIGDIQDDSLFFAYDSAGKTAIGNSPTDITFDTEVRENADYNHLADSAEITINTNGNYIVDYECSIKTNGTARYTAFHWLELNTGSGFSEIAGTRSASYHRTTNDGYAMASIYRYIPLGSGDIIKVQIQADSTGVLSTLPNSCRIMIKRVDNVSGFVGPAGIPGADGDITWQGTWISQNYTKNQAVEYNGSSYVCILDTISNEVPTNTTYWDLVVSKGDQGVPGTAGGGTDEETFIIDANDTGGDLSLQFGTTLSENITWDNTNTEFNISDDLAIGNGIAEDIYLGFNDDDGSHHKFGWDDSEGNFSTFGEDIESECGPYGIFWAERGTITSNASWALGNGQSPYGSIMGCNGSVTKLAATCTGSIGTSLNAVLRKNNVATTCTVNLSTTVGQATISNCSESFISTDVLGIYAGTETGSWTECVGTFWVKYD